MSRAGRRTLVLWILTGAACALYVGLILDMGLWRKVLGALYRGSAEPIYPRAPLIALVGEHLVLVGLSTAIAAALGLALGVLVTRSRGSRFAGLLDDLSALSQTIPPVAVLALSVPLLGFGAPPTILALFLYSLLPIVHNTIAGLRSAPADVVEAARGMGMTGWQRLAGVELPLALPVVMAGIRTSVVINIGTASIGAVVGAGGLGAPIISGLVRQEPSLVLEGAAAAALLAILLDQVLARAESTLASPRGATSPASGSPAGPPSR